jgi:hypothetical protein
MYSLVLAAVSVALLAILLFRAIAGGFTSRLPFFLSYVSYILIGTVVTTAVFFLWPSYHARLFWLYFLFSIIVEFAVLVEVSDHIFRPYQAFRNLGRLACLSTSGIFLVFYVLPSLIRPATSRARLLEIAQSACLAKAIIILALFAAVRLYKLSMGRSIAGVLLGFSIYLGVNIANFQLAELYGQVYASTFRIVGPLSWTIGSLVWVVALWNYEPGVVASPASARREQRIPVPLETQLDRFNNALLRLLER